MRIEYAFTHVRAELTAKSQRRQTLVAEWILTELLECSRAHLYAYPERALSPAMWGKFIDMVRRHKRGEPLQYITGTAYFYGMPFRVTPDVLIPRPETEILVDAALEMLPDSSGAHVLDVGTGSGCIAISIAKSRESATVDATDISRVALEVARQNAQSHGISIRFIQHDMASANGDLPEAEYDLIVSNPPYVPTNERQELPADVRDYEPPLALFSGDDPMHYFKLLDDMARARLSASGTMLVEVHAPLAKDVVKLFEGKHWRTLEVINDLTGRPRIVKISRLPDTRS